MNNTSAAVDVVHFDPEAFGCHLARELPESLSVNTQIYACNMVEEGLRFVWRCQGVPPAEIEARNAAWFDAFCAHLLRQAEDPAELRCEANASAEH